MSAPDRSPAEACDPTHREQNRPLRRPPHNSRRPGFFGRFASDKPPERGRRRPGRPGRHGAILRNPPAPEPPRNSAGSCADPPPAPPRSRIPGGLRCRSKPDPRPGKRPCISRAHMRPHGCANPPDSNPGSNWNIRRVVPPKPAPPGHGRPAGASACFGIPSLKPRPPTPETV